MKNILLISVFFLCCCQNIPDTKRFYSYQFQQDSCFDEADVDLMMNNEHPALDESQLSDCISWSKMKRVDSIFLKKNAIQLYLYHYNSESDGSYFCYTTKTGVKLVVYGSKAVDTGLIYILKDVQFKSILNELIKNDHFISNQINESGPIPLIHE